MMRENKLIHLSYKKIDPQYPIILEVTRRTYSTKRWYNLKFQIELFNDRAFPINIIYKKAESNKN